MTASVHAQEWSLPGGNVRLSLSPTRYASLLRLDGNGFGRGAVTYTDVHAQKTDVTQRIYKVSRGSRPETINVRSPDLIQLHSYMSHYHRTTYHSGGSFSGRALVTTLATRLPVAAHQSAGSLCDAFSQDGIETASEMVASERRSHSSSMTM